MKPTPPKKKKILLPFIPRKVKNSLKDSILSFPYHVLSNLFFQLKQKKFYGQTAEDALLQRLLPEKKGTYVDIGGGHPIKFSNTYSFYRRGWTGISVDAIKSNTVLYRFMRPRDKVIHALIGNDRELKDFHVFEPYGLSTADPEVAQEVLKIKDVRLLEINRIKSIPLSDIAPAVTPETPSFLSIDVEGLDLMVLMTNNWLKFRPRFICVENWKGTGRSKEGEIEFYLKSENYSLIAFTGLSEIYIANEFLRR